MAGDHGRVVAHERGADQAVDVGRRRRNDDFKAGRIAHHALRTVTVLCRAAAAHAMQEMESHRHRYAAAGHVITDRGFIGDLRPSQIAEASRTEIDKWPHPGHGGADTGCRCACFRGWRVVNPVSKILAETVHQVALWTETEDVTADQTDAIVGGKTVIERIDQSCGITLFGHFTFLTQRRGRKPSRDSVTDCSRRSSPPHRYAYRCLHRVT